MQNARTDDASQTTMARQNAELEKEQASTAKKISNPICTNMLPEQDTRRWISGHSESWAEDTDPISQGK